MAQRSRRCSRRAHGSPTCASARRSTSSAMRAQDDPRRSAARAAPALLPPPRSFQRTRLSPGRALPVRPLRAPLARSLSATGRAAAATSSPASCPFRAPSPGRSSSPSSSQTSRWGMRQLPGAARRPAGEARLGPRGARSPRGDAHRRSSSPSAAQLVARLVDPRRGRLPGQGHARAQPPLPARQLRGRAGASPPTLDFQDQLDRWCERINARVHRATRAVVAERLDQRSESGCERCPSACPTPTGAS